MHFSVIFPLLVRISKCQTVKNWIFKIRISKFSSKSSFFFNFLYFGSILSSNLKMPNCQKLNFKIRIPEFSSKFWFFLRVVFKMTLWYFKIWTQGGEIQRKIKKEWKFTTKFRYSHPEKLIFDSLTFRNSNLRLDKN